MVKNVKISAIFLFVLALGQNLLNETFNRSLTISIIYYIAFWILSFICFRALSMQVKSIILKIASYSLGLLYPLLYSMGFINSLVDLGVNENLFRNLTTFLSFVIFLLFSIGLFREKNINEKKLTAIKIVTIIHTVLFLVSPLLTFFSKWLFYGLLLPIFLYKKKVETVKLKNL